MKRLLVLMTALVMIAITGMVLDAAQASKSQAAGSGKPATSKPAPKPAPKLAIPAPIEAAFKKAYPNATINNISKETVNGHVEYEVESIDAGLHRDLMYLSDGTVSSYEEEVAQASVPDVVMQAVKARYPKAMLGMCEKSFSGGKMQYEIALKGAAVSSVELTPEGVWISPKLK